MDQTALAIAQAVALAGTVGMWLSVLQEYVFRDRLTGRPAVYVSMAAALIVGIVATAQTGGFVAVGDTSDPFGAAARVVANAGVALAASQAAFRVFVRPITS